MWGLKKLIKPAGWCLVVLLSVMVLSACGKEEKIVIATYEGGEVTESEFAHYQGTMQLLVPNYEQMQNDPAFAESELNKYIAIKIISDEADKAVQKEQRNKAEEEFQELKQFVQSQRGKNEWDKLLEEAGVEDEHIENYMGRLNIVNEILGKDITEEELKAEYAKRAENHAFDIVTVSHILISTVNLESTDNEAVRTKEEALTIAGEIKDKLDRGEDFAKLAKEYSDDKGSAQNGGTIPDRNVNGYVEPFRNAVLELPIGEISEPVETDFGYHIIRVDSRKALEYDELDESDKDSLRSAIISARLADYMEKELPDKMSK
jgi:foldase protein PrsA